MNQHWACAVLEYLNFVYVIVLVDQLRIALSRIMCGNNPNLHAMQTGMIERRQIWAGSTSVDEINACETATFSSVVSPLG